jgi:hypothetical protein
MKKDFLNRQLSSLSRQIAEEEVNLAAFQKANPELMEFLTFAESDSAKNKLLSDFSRLNEEILSNRSTKDLLLRLPQAKKGEHEIYKTALESQLIKLSDLQYQLRLTEESPDPDKTSRISIIKKEIDTASKRMAELNEEMAEAYLNNPLAPDDVSTRISKLELDYQVLLIEKKNTETKIEKANLIEKNFSQKRLDLRRLKSDIDLS